MWRDHLSNASLNVNHLLSFSTCTAPMKSLSAMAIRSPKKSFSSILNERQMLLRLAPSGSMFVKKGNKYSFL